MREKIRKVKDTANELYKAIKELDKEVNYYNELIRNITKNVKEIKEIENNEKTNNKI